MYEPSHASISVWDSRLFFFEFIRQIAPEVLEELRGLPFALYRTVFPLDRWHVLENEMGRLWYVFEEDSYPRDPSIFELRNSLDFWSKKFNLRDQWCVEKAFKTLDQWYQNPRFADALMWAREVYGYFPPVGMEEGKFTFTFHTGIRYHKIGATTNGKLKRHSDNIVLNTATESKNSRASADS